MVQFIPLVIVPQVFFTRIFPLDGMSDWLQKIGKVMPLYYASDAMNGIMYKGFTFNEVLLDLLILLAFAVVFITINIISLKNTVHYEINNNLNKRSRFLKVRGSGFFYLDTFN